VRTALCSGHCVGGKSSQEQKNMKLARLAGCLSSSSSATFTICASIVVLALATSCAAPSAQVSAHQKAEVSARLALKARSAAAKRVALAADGGGSVVRIGVMPGLTGAAGLVGARLGYLQQALGPGVRLQLVPFTSVTAEGNALAAGRLDAAYADPVTVVRVWLASDRKLIKVLAGAAEVPGSQGGTTTALLVVTSKLLRTRSAVADAVLKGQIQAEQLLATDPVAALGAADAELASLGVHGAGYRQLASSFRRLRFTNDPQVASVLAQAKRAAARGQVQPLPSSMAGLFDLGPLNKLLRAAGQSAVPG
jgi:ABC-type nitrate/sulfonate/bicarbonate transport system substrate-binding protein